MLTGFDMANALEHCAKHLDATGQPDSADRCRAGAEEIKRLLHVIRTRDRHIAELQAEIFVCDGSDETKLDALKDAVREAVKPIRAFVRQNSVQTVVDDWPYGHAGRAPKGFYLRDLRAIAALHDICLKSARLEESKD